MRSPYRHYKNWVITYVADQKDLKWIATKVDCLSANDLQALKIKIDERVE